MKKSAIRFPSNKGRPAQHRASRPGSCSIMAPDITSDEHDDVCDTGEFFDRDTLHVSFSLP